MSVQYVKGTFADYDEIVDFANYVFSHDHCKHDFPALIPKLYGRGVDTTEHHYLAKLNGRIIASVCSYPMTANIMGEQFRVAGIGTVAAHPYHRGSGYMTVLMKSAVDDMKTQGIALAELGGQRQRYENFGFTPCGTKLDITVIAKNLQRLKNAGQSTYRFVPLESGDLESINKAQALQCRLPIHCVRGIEEFHTICLSWYRKPYILLKDNEFFGYIICSTDFDYISEIEMGDTADLSGVLLAYLSQFGVESVNLSLPPYEKEKVGILQSYCESITIHMPESFNVFDYEGLVRQLLKLKATYATLMNGSLVLEIEKYVRLCIEVEGQRISVCRTDEPADCMLPHLEAMRLLFSPVGAFYRYAPQLDCFVNSWFPLPLYWPSTDSV